MTGEATYIVYDTETGGKDPREHDLLQVGAVATSPDATLAMFCQAVTNSKSIPAPAKGIHGLTEAYLAQHGVPRQTALDRFAAFVRRFASPVLVAFNKDFDAAFMGFDSHETAHQLCAMRLAQHLFPGADDYKNQTLRHYRNLEVDTLGLPSHHALGDALVTAALLRDELASDEFLALGIDDVHALIDYAEAPIVFKTWPFGQYRGQPINVAPRSYVDWALNKMADLSPDMRYTLQRLRAA
jgi:DNA polymerase III epsilon subunit-like protein